MKIVKHIKTLKSAMTLFLDNSLICLFCLQMYKTLASIQTGGRSEDQLGPSEMSRHGELLDKAKYALFATMDSIEDKPNHVSCKLKIISYIHTLAICRTPYVVHIGCLFQQTLSGFDGLESQWLNSI